MIAKYLLLSFALLAPTALAQPAGGSATSPEMKMPANMSRAPLPTPRDPDAIPLNTGGVADMPPEAWERFMGQPTVRNVSRATLTPVLPAPSHATGAAVIVLPGGGFYGLSMKAEGSSVARFLADHGIAAFVLKYRINPTPAKAEDVDGFLQRTMGAMFAAKGKLEFPTPPQSLEDSQAALRLVRARSKEWGVDPKRIGMLGFSAGAILSLATTLANSSEKPDFVGLLYPPMDVVEVPSGAPPLFVGIAADDPLFGGKGYGLAESWTRARRPVELHVYQKGGHGYGMGVPGSTTTDWAPGFVHWLQMNGLLGDGRSGSRRIGTE